MWCWGDEGESKGRERRFNEMESDGEVRERRKSRIMKKMYCYSWIRMDETRYCDVEEVMRSESNRKENKGM